jgi:hypothetical protein
MPLNTFLYNLLNVLVQIANKLGLQNCLIQQKGSETTLIKNQRYSNEAVTLSILHRKEASTCILPFSEAITAFSGVISRIVRGIIVLMVII